MASFLYQIAGKDVGKDDQVALVRGSPANLRQLSRTSVSDWMRGQHNGPLKPVSFKDVRCTRFDGTPRVIAAGFQLSNGRLIVSQDMFDDPEFDCTRNKAQEIAELMRRHGAFEPHRLRLEDMEYTTLPKMMEKLRGRFESLE